jgi:hypothetical protein
MRARLHIWIAAVAGRVSPVGRLGRSRATTASAASPGHSPAPSLFDSLQHVLRLAGQCPPGGEGDDIRRGACELIEASSTAAGRVGRRRMLKAIARVESRRSRGRGRQDDPSPATLQGLTDALRL